MADYVAGKGTTAMSIIGTVLGGLGVLGNHAGTMFNSGDAYEYHNATMHDIEDTQKLAAKDAEIAQLKSEKYADAVRDDAKQYGIEIYKELKGNLTQVTNDLSAQISALKDRESDKWTDQAVINANVTNAITALNGQVSTTANLVAEITRTAVRQDAICNFKNGGCSSCGNNI